MYLCCRKEISRSGPTALYDLFRIESGKIVEHWDV